MSGPEIRPATAADLAAFYGAVPRRSMRALVVVLDGRPIAVGGIAYQKDGAYLFSDFADEMYRHPKAIMRAGRMLFAGLRGVRCLAATSTPRGARFLGHFGLRYLRSTDDGQMIYEWSGGQ